MTHGQGSNLSLQGSNMFNIPTKTTTSFRKRPSIIEPEDTDENDLEVEEALEKFFQKYKNADNNKF